MSYISPYAVHLASWQEQRRSKVVCLDTCYKRTALKDKLAQIADSGAVAVVLLLHSKPTRTSRAATRNRITTT